jgi:hypothetical protein
MALLISSCGFVLAGALAGAAVTRHGHSIEVAVARFLLFYAGVFALIALTAAVGIGVLATDRIVMLPGGRIIAQAVHRAVSFGAVGFLVIHIIVEVLARRSMPGDAVVPFLDHGQTLYLGLGTIASDLVLLIVVTGIMRGRFATAQPVWMWRALHATSYAAWPLAILHGLLAGRTAKPYVDWSYGACIAAVGLALVIRVVAGVRVREMASNPVPALGPWLPAGAGSPLERAASLPLAYGGRERLAIAAPVAQEAPADDEPFDGELLDGPPYEQQDDEPGDYQPGSYGQEHEPGSYEPVFTGFAASNGAPSGPGPHDPPPYYPGPHSSGPSARAAYARAARARAAQAHAAPASAAYDRGPAAGAGSYQGAPHGGGYQGGPYGGEADRAPLDSNMYYRGPYDPDLYGQEPPTDPRMFAPGTETWSADASARWSP